MRFLTKTLTAATLACMFAFAFSLIATTAKAQSRGEDLWVTTPGASISLAELFKSIQKQTGYTFF